jgi:DNA-binding LytR/AlgR family response regulator
VEALRLAIERSGSFGGSFQYQKGHDYINVPVDEVIYFENCGRKIRIVTVEDEDFYYGGMDQAELAVSKYQFVRISRSHLVNYRHVEILNFAEVFLSNGEALGIGRAYREGLRDLQMGER